MLAVKRSAGVAPEVNLRNPLQAGDEAHKQGIYPRFEVLNRGINTPTKRTDVLQNSFLKNHVSITFANLCGKAQRIKWCNLNWKSIDNCSGYVPKN